MDILHHNCFPIYEPLFSSAYQSKIEACIYGKTHLYIQITNSSILEQVTIDSGDLDGQGRYSSQCSPFAVLIER